jgi:prepilin-type N-terminal cleavage/methylation domain-containing protein
MKNRKNGYSLIEVLAALAIISIAILPIMSMYPAIFKQNKKT